MNIPVPVPFEPVIPNNNRLLELAPIHKNDVLIAFALKVALKFVGIFGIDNSVDADKVFEL